MIIAKTDKGRYINQHGVKIKSKQEYLDEKKDVEAITEPTNEELIELGKAQHSFYMKDLMIENIDNNIKEIDEFEKSKDIKIIEEIKL